MADYTDNEFESYFSSIQKGKLKLFKTLDQDFGDTVLRAMALEEAVEIKRDSIILYLLERYDFSKQALGIALHKATAIGSEELMQRLLAKGAPHDFKINDLTPLMVASKKQNQKIINLFLVTDANNEHWDWQSIASGVAAVAATAIVFISYLKTLAKGTWQGIKLLCPNCREPL